MKRFFLFLIFFQFCITCYCQERNATIVFIDNTTMEGLGEIKRNKIYFRISEEDEKTEWNYEMAKGIIFSGYGFYEKYEYQKPDKYSNPIIMEVVEEGDINLYRKNQIGTYTPNFRAGDIRTIFPATNQTFHKPTDAGNSAPPYPLTDDFATTYFVKRDSEEFATEISFSFKSRSLKYFADCESIIKKIKSRTFNSKNIPEIVTYYNNYCYTEEE
ncbi:MAG TPA: hypothetical protein VLB74_01010 [Flavobacterium sp.]|uniref:hypothetical protein n=1 Tax=Flavobacterium sp. TaxID=239 RepID=UPI002C07C1E0|nr:hypothetical protein [Flavobacterium sp.]HSD13205.1 hypothetical protein [Flavobacterium sp.]